MTSKIEKMPFMYTDKEGVQKTFTIGYKLWFNGETLTDVSTVHNQMVTKNSMVWEYFNTKYN